MDIVIWCVCIGGIFGLLIIGCMMLLKSGENRRLHTKKHKELVKQINQTNRQLDESLIELQKLNGPLEKVNEVFTKINDKVFK